MGPPAHRTVSASGLEPDGSKTRRLRHVVRSSLVYPLPPEYPHTRTVLHFSLSTVLISHFRSLTPRFLQRYNSADTNALVQAEYKIVLPQREWHVPGTLESHGLNIKAFDSLKLVDFKIDDPAQR